MTAVVDRPVVRHRGSSVVTSIVATMMVKSMCYTDVTVRRLGVNRSGEVSSTVVSVTATRRSRGPVCAVVDRRRGVGRLRE